MPTLTNAYPGVSRRHDGFLPRQGLGRETLGVPITIWPLFPQCTSASSFHHRKQIFNLFALQRRCKYKHTSLPIDSRSCAHDPSSPTGPILYSRAILAYCIAKADADIPCWMHAFVLALFPQEHVPMIRPQGHPKGFLYAKFRLCMHSYKCMH